MPPHKPLRWIWMGMACLLLTPMSAQAYDEDYLRERTYHMDPSEMPRLPMGSGDYPQDYQYTGNPNVGEAQARRQRVETRVNQYMQGLKEHDDSEPEVSSQQISKLAAQAQQGDAQSMAGMGYAYQHGLGVEKNEKLAVQWYQRAAEYGEAQYYSTIGDMYRDYGANNERGFFGDIRAMMGGKEANAVRKDNNIARQWYEKGIQHPDKDWRSFAALGEMYRDGVGGLEKDMTKANAHYNRGMFIKQRIDEQTMRMVQKMARDKAEDAEGIEDVPPPAVSRQAAPMQTPQDSTEAIIIIDNARCTYEKSTVSRRGYSQIFSANCPDLRSRRLQVDSVGMAGLECKADQQSNGASVMLLCNAATQERVRIGDAECVMRTEPKQEGYAAVFGAYCNAEPQAALPPVSYQGMTCEIEAGSAQGKTYTLLCGAALAPSTQQQDTAPTITGRIGAYSCSLRQMESPSTSYKFVYEAYCGGLKKEQKSSGAIPGTVSIGVNLCNVEPWPDNDEGKDFELYCR